MWLVEQYGVEAFKEKITEEVTSYDRGVVIEDEQPRPTGHFERRNLVGVHPQAQEGLKRVGILVPAGRLSAKECREIADLAEKYSNSEIRLTVEQNVILPNVDENDVDALLNEPAVQGTRLKIDAGFIESNLVSCTGAQFCGLALIETKANAESIVQRLEREVIVDRPIRIHYTGCMNSCGQVQAADIGIMGGPAKKENEEGVMKAVPGCKIFVGGTIGENGKLSLEPYLKAIPLHEDDLVPVLVDILKEKFGAKDR